jgi:hypothetical protein
MDRQSPDPPDPGTGKRRQVDRAALSAALADQARRDAERPPASLLTTMGAVRLVGDLILDRQARGWTDPMLVVLLRELGLEISTETLRVYRGRLKKERGGELVRTGEVVTERPSPALPQRASKPAEVTVTDEQELPRAVQAEQITRHAHGSEEDDQPPFDRSIPFDDRV